MNRIITICAAVLMTASVFAQSPEKMSYQAVVRDGSDALVATKTVGMQISILHGTSTGTAVYTETQTPTTNTNGLVSLEIGSGTVVSGTFASIDWSDGPYFIKTETDPVGGTSYSITGTSQLMSVPYALHAKTAATVDETDPAYTQSEAANITASDITNLGNLSGTNTGDQDLSGYLTAEADPAYTQSEAANITASDITNLGNLSGTNTGDQDLSGYLTTEADPTYTQSEAANITASDITNLGNLSGTNTGDNAVNSLYSSLITNATHTGDVTGSGALTIANKVTMTATAPVSVSGSPTVIAASPVAISIAAATTSEAGSMSAADKTKLDNIATGAEVNVNADWNAVSGDAQILNKPTIPAAADGSETKVTAGTNVTVTGTGTTASPYVVNSTVGGDSGGGGFTHYLGEEYLDGIIFYLYTDNTGTQKGLVVSKTETTATWSGSTLVGADRTEDGAYNTNLMPSGSTAKTWVTGLGTGWYLPSIDELSILWHNRFHVNKTARAVNSPLLSRTAIYWSSTEIDASNAFIFHFNLGNSFINDKATAFSVRAVRAF